MNPTSVLSPEIVDLGLAIGLLRSSNGSVAFDDDWLSDPGPRVSTALADNDRRAAIVRFAAAALGDSGTHMDSGVTHIQLFDAAALGGAGAPNLVVELTLDERAATFVEVGLAVTHQTAAPVTTRTSLAIPMYRTGKRSGAGPVAAVAEHFALAAGSPLRLSSSITLGDGAPDPSGFGLAGIAIAVDVPVTGADPAISIGLQQLRLPGSTSAIDLDIGGPGATIEDALISVVMGAVKAGASTLGGVTGDAALAILDLVGLGPGTGLPKLDLQALASGGVAALRSWFTNAMNDATTRANWLDTLGDVIGGARSGEDLIVPLGGGPVQLRLAVVALEGPGGHLRATPRVGIELSSTLGVGPSAVRLSAIASIDLATIDLSDGQLTAMPQASLVIAATGDGATRLIPTGPLQIGSVRVGVSVINGAVQPLLALGDVEFEGTVTPVLDLSSADAVVASVGQVAGTLVAAALGALGAAGTSLQALLGLTPPGGVPALDAASLLTNPLGALGSWWQELSTTHAAQMPGVLTHLRDLVATDSNLEIAVTGLGTPPRPWSIPIADRVSLDVWRDGPLLIVAPTLSKRIVDLGGGCTVVSTTIRAELAAIDLVAGHVSLLRSAALTTSVRGRGLDHARLALGPVALVADEISISANWSAATGFAVDIAAPGLAADIGAGNSPTAIVAGLVPLSLPTQADWSSAVFADVEALVGVLAASNPSGWLHDLVALLGWDLGEQSPHRLSLAAVVGDAPTELARWSRRVAADADVIGRLTTSLARLFTGDSLGSSGSLNGRGTPADPWTLALGTDSDSPALTVALGPHGPVIAPSQTSDVLRTWRPGLAGLPAAGLFQALVDEADVGDDIAALVRGRAPAAAGLAAIVSRVIGTDVLVASPPTPIVGLSVVARPATVWTDWDGLPVAEVLGVTPDPAAAVIRVAIGTPTANPWATQPAARRLDLSGPGLSPESFSVASPSPGEWFVILATRADAALSVADPTGLLGQAARLRRVISALGNGRPVVLVASGGSGHAARLAADAESSVTHLVTLGTPWSAVAFETARTGASADALRLLRALLPAVDLADPDDADLAVGRALVTGMLSERAQIDIEAPRPELAVRAGLIARAQFGALDIAAVERATTAVIAAGMAARAQARVPLAADVPTSADVGLRVPVGTSLASGGITIGGSISLGLTGSVFATGAVAAAPNVTIHLVLGAESGWLVGGPGTTPAGGAFPLEVRAVEFRGCFGLQDRPSNAELILHEVAALGAYRDRIIVRSDGMASGATEELPFLPEARAVLSAVVDRLRSAAPNTSAANLVALFDAVGLSVPSGLVPDALVHLLHDPKAFAAQQAASVVARTGLAQAAAVLVPGAARTGDVVTITRTGALNATIALDLGTRSATVSAASSFGALPWAIELIGLGTANPSGSATVGDPGFNTGALRLSVGPLAVVLIGTDSSDSPTTTALWPTTDIGGLGGFVAAALPAEATRLLLDAIRGLDGGVAAAIDALSGALGILGPPDGLGRRRTIAPVALFRDPVGWFRSVLDAAPAQQVERLVDLFEAVKPFVGLDGTPRGGWPIVPGVQLAVGSGVSGPQISLAIDPTVWLGGVDRAPFSAGVAISLAIAAAGPPNPAVAVFIGLPEQTPTEAHRRAVHLALDSTGLRALVRPTSGSDIALFPNPAGLGALLSVGVEQLLPMALNAVAELTGSAARDQIGELVSAIGRGLDIVTDPDNAAIRATFDGDKLGQLAADPVGRLTTRAVVLLGQAVGALNPLISQLPGSPTAVMTSGNLVVTVRGVTLTLDPNPLSVSISGALSGLPFVGTASGGFSVDGDGLQQWQLGIGPASFDLGGPTVRPLVRAGRLGTGGWEVALGLALDGLAPSAETHHELFGRWREADGLAVVARTHSSGVDNDDTDAAAVAMFAADATLELLGSWLIGLPALGTLLDTTVGPLNSSVRSILQGSVLSTLDDHAVMPGVVSRLPGSLFVLARNLVNVLPAVQLGPFSLALHEDNGLIGIRLDVTSPTGLELNPGSDIVLSLVTDADWVALPAGGHPPPGIAVDFISIGAGDDPQITIEPAISVNGVGLKIASASGPLLDAGLRIEAVAVHLFGALGADGVGGVKVSGGIELQFDGLAVPLSGGGGTNTVAQGVVNDAGGSGAPPAPKFSPALSVQHHHGTDGVAVSLRAGSGDGPWYLPIQRAFGPVYIEQIGLGASHTGSPPTTPKRLESISLSIDGQVSLFGLTASVDKLRLTYHVNQAFFEATSWEVDLDGFALSSEIGGLTLVGALRRAPLSAPLQGVEYLGMLKIGFSGYGLDLFGGYAHPTGPQGSFASFFAFGALHAPLGGPPAFFVTGIGLGFGINRELAPPTIENITTNVFMVAMKALGPAPDPMAQLEQMRTQIRPAQGQYWVAAGISFTSFVLISGEVVATVAFGDGLDIAVLGLARAELPSPGFTLVSIELGLIARFSTKEGTALIAAQLTENSWLLHPSVRLTGGFAFQTWWKGPNAGQFVVTLGGYHPSFHHDGYPTVPRLGLSWKVSDNISIVGESYFALCSEALMAGTSMEVSAHFGPAHASLSYGADGIVFFDPFWFRVSAWAEVRAGIRIWLLFGTVDIELSLGVFVEVTGPPIHVEGRFEICGFEVPFEFGDEGNPADNALKAGEFRDKYLRASADAQVIQASIVKGATTSGQRSDGSQQKVPDGSPLNPFLVIPEFRLVLISTAPVIDMELSHTNPSGGPPDAASPKTTNVDVPELGVAPMYSDSLASKLVAVLTKLDNPRNLTIKDVSLIERTGAAFPKGVWGEAPNPAKPAIPAGEIVEASDGFVISTVLADPAGAPAIDYHQVELPFHGRKPLPFVTNTAAANVRVGEATALKAVADVVRSAAGDLHTRFHIAALVLNAGGYGVLGVAALRNERAAPPVFGSLADDLVLAPTAESPRVTPTIVDRTKGTRAFVAPIVSAVIGMPLSAAIVSHSATTVAEPGKVARMAPPTLAAVREAAAKLAPASIVVRPRIAVGTRSSLTAIGPPPLTRIATSAIGAVANARPAPVAAQRLERMSDGLSQGSLIHEGELIIVNIVSRATSGTGETVRVNGGRTRVIALAAGGNVLFDNAAALADPAAGRAADQFETTLPVKTERAVVIAIGERSGIGGTFAGWYVGQSLPLVGWDIAVGHGVLVTFAGHKARPNSQRGDGGWVNTRDAINAATVTTRFAAPITVVAVAVDDATHAGARDPAATLDMRLVGAQRATDKAGVPIAPVVLAQGVRTIMIFAIVADGRVITRTATVAATSVLVVIEGTRDGQVGGVIGSTGTVADLVEALSSSGFDAAVGAALVGGPGVRSVQWKSAAEAEHNDVLSPQRVVAGSKSRRRPAAAKQLKTTRPRST